MELSILAWGAVILFTGFVGSFIVYTIHFLIAGRLSLTERNGKSETEKAIGEQVKPVKRQVALLKRRVKILEAGIVGKKLGRGRQNEQAQKRTKK